MPRTPKQGRAKATVEALLEAGFVCVARHGIEGTTTRAIADVAGVSVGSLYEYFGDKEDVLAAMHARFTRDVVDTLTPLFPEVVKLDVAEAVRRLVDAFGELLHRNGARYRTFAKAALAGHPKLELEPLTKELAGLVVQYLLHHPELTRLRNVPAMSYVLIHGGIGVLVQHLSEPTPQVPFDDLSRALADMVDHWVAHELASQAR